MTKPDRPSLTPALRWRAEAEAQHKPAPEELERMSQKDMRATLHELRVHQIELEMQNEELLRVQGKLEEARARYYDLYDLAPVGYLILAPDGQIQEANQTAVSLLGAARATLVKQPITRFILNLDQDIYYLFRKQFLQTGEPQGCDLRLVKADGTVFWAHMAAGAASPEPPVNRVVLVDITERKRIEVELARSETALRATQELARVGSWEWDVRNQVMSWSREMYRLHQLRPGDPLPGPVPLARSLECYLPEDQALLQAAFTRCVEHGEPYDLKCRITTAKGRLLWIRTRAEPVTENGIVVRVAGITMDIVGRRLPARGRMTRNDTSQE
jgi:PAS domain S-box-containing protein